jgi:hypothetical protein
MPKSKAVTTKVTKVDVSTTINYSTTVVELDDTIASELLAKFEANKENKATLEAEYKTLQEQIYALLGYKKVGTKWIGTAEAGTIAGVEVVKVGTQTRSNFDKEKFLQSHPELLAEFEKFTEQATHTVLKTTR